MASRWDWPSLLVRFLFVNARSARVWLRAGTSLVSFDQAGYPAMGSAVRVSSPPDATSSRNNSILNGIFS